MKSLLSILLLISIIEFIAITFYENAYIELDNKYKDLLSQCTEIVVYENNIHECIIKKNIKISKDIK